MTSTTETAEILKADAKGRVRVSKERRAALLDEFERSGLSGAKFSAHYGLKYPSFAGCGGEAMLSFTGSLKVFVAVEPCDLRRGHNGLLALVGEKLQEDVKSGALFVFTNKRRRLLKILYWDRTGLWLASKRLEQGTFSWPRSVESGTLKLKLAPEALAMLTDSRAERDSFRQAARRAGAGAPGNVDLRSGTLRPWYERT